jgi:hypothetical protein
MEVLLRAFPFTGVVSTALVHTAVNYCVFSKGSAGTSQVRQWPRDLPVSRAKNACSLPLRAFQGTLCQVCQAFLHPLVLLVVYKCTAASTEYRH